MKQVPLKKAAVHVICMPTTRGIECSSSNSPSVTWFISAIPAIPGGGERGGEPKPPPGTLFISFHRLKSFFRK